jgi:hypothetical protein
MKKGTFPFYRALTSWLKIKTSTNARTHQEVFLRPHGRLLRNNTKGDCKCADGALRSVSIATIVRCCRKDLTAWAKIVGDDCIIHVVISWRRVALPRMHIWCQILHAHLDAIQHKVNKSHDLGSHFCAMLS